MIQRRLGQANQRWLDLMSKIAKIGPPNAAILDTEKRIIQRDEKQTLLIDESLVPKLRFVREGDLNDEPSGETALRLVGDVHPVATVEITKIQNKRLLELYPLTCTEVIAQVKARLPSVKEPAIYQAIKENDLKNNLAYSSYNFRSKRQEEKARTAEIMPKGIPSIYNQNAVEFLVKVLQSSR